MSATYINFWREANRLLQGGHRFFLAVVAGHSDHSPGTTGAKLLVSAAGKTVGTIGGGIMERNVVERAVSILRQNDFVPELQTLMHRATGEGEKSGMICAGSQTNLYLLCTPEKDTETVAAILSCLQNDRAGTLRIDSGGLAMETEAPRPGSYAASPRYELQADGPQWRFTEQLLCNRRVVILGGGHCASALAPVMARLGYVVTVMAQGTEKPPLAAADSGTVHIIAVNDYSETAALIDHVDHTRVVIMTTDVAGDVAGLVALQSLPLPFIGVLGSLAKIAIIRERAEKALGQPLDETHLYAPVGLPIDSHTPEEIAISIAAQLLALEAEFAQDHLAGREAVQTL